jgi:hypothetical protein
MCGLFTYLSIGNSLTAGGRGWSLRSRGLQGVHWHIETANLDRTYASVYGSTGIASFR